MSMIFTLTLHSPKFNENVNLLERESKILIDWFSFNWMQAYSNKFQTIAVGKQTHDKSPIFHSDPISINGLLERPKYTQ